jgi:hypothetical protein
LYKDELGLWAVVDLLKSADHESAPADLIEDFRALAGGSENEVLAFVRRYGLPVPPAEQRHFVPSRESSKSFRDAFGKGDWWGAKVTAIQHYARLLDAALRVHGYVESKGQGGWAAIEPYVRLLSEFLTANGLWHHKAHEFFLRKRLEEEKGQKRGQERHERELYLTDRTRWDVIQTRRVADLLDWWLEKGGARQRAEQRGGGKVRFYRAVGIWNVIGELVRLRLVDVRKVAICSFCGREYAVKRAPRANARFRCCGRAPCKRAYNALRKRMSRSKRQSAG